MTVNNTTAVVRQWIGSIPNRPEFAQFYIGKFDGTELRYTDYSGRVHAVPSAAIHGGSVLRDDVPYTVIAVQNGAVYALTPVKLIGGD